MGRRLVSDMDVLRELVRDDAVLTLTVKPYGKQEIVLKETGSNKPYQVKICDIPDDAFVFKADKFPDTRKFFNGNKGECKRADFIIVVRTSGINWIIYIEIKSGSGQKKEIEQQLRGAECVIAYCRAVGRGFWERPDFLNKDEYHQRFISIKKVGAQKRPTRTPPDMNRVHDRPEKMLTISAPSRKGIRFKEIASSQGT